MKIAVISAVIALAFASCTKETVVQNEAAATPVPATPTPALATPTPEVAVATATPPPATPAPQLAPEGIFYLIAAASIETSDGVRGLPAGTGVKLVRPGVYLTPYGETALPAEQLTNDLSVARSARDAAVAAQTAAAQRGAADAAVANARARAAAVETAANHEAALKGIDRERLERKIAELKRQKIVVDEQVNLLGNKRSRENYNEYWKGRTVTSNTDQQMAAARVQSEMLSQQIDAAQQQLASLR
jgi:hypothetical protein